jgi:predicted HTH domain antitoxin
MAVTFQLPANLEQDLRQDLGDLDGEAKEAFLVDLYRRGKLSHLALSEALALDRFETEDVLHKHNVIEDLGTVEDYLRDARTLEELRDASRR